MSSSKPPRTSTGAADDAGLQTLLALPLDERRDAVAKDVRRRAPQFSAILAHDLAPRPARLKTGRRPPWWIEGLPVVGAQWQRAFKAPLPALDAYEVHLCCDYCELQNSRHCGARTPYI